MSVLTTYRCAREDVLFGSSPKLLIAPLSHNSQPTCKLGMGDAMTTAPLCVPEFQVINETGYGPLLFVSTPSLAGGVGPTEPPQRVLTAPAEVPLAKILRMAQVILSAT